MSLSITVECRQANLHVDAEVADCAIVAPEGVTGSLAITTTNPEHFGTFRPGQQYSVSIGEPMKVQPANNGKVTA